ncbi:hypothetical protein F8M41_016811 [Gigaspora margarita]|uniref:Uncharacterized protein n=1 Tax=Gigaspora margarita TaxID=4874 RepID=A0A8H4ANY9_GIGMA|nr:hypothetical protein F8M41_016811 [Gigaspora margarita]
MSSSETMPSEELTSSKGDAPNMKDGVTENDVTGTTGIKRAALLHKENEYLMKKITEELTTWSNNNTNSAKYTVISIVISTIALLFGVILYIFEKSNYKQEIKNIISTSIIGTGGSVTLLGSLVSLKELFKRASEGAKDFENTLKSFKALFQDDDKVDQIDEKEIKKIKELEDHLKDQKQIYIFLDGLNKHMQHMSICRSISVSITSLMFVMLAIISVFYLLFNDDDTIFIKIDIFLISFSAYCLFYSICVMICIQIIIPSVTEKMLDPNYLESFEKYCSTRDISEEDKFKRYNSTISLKDLLGFLSYRIYKESWLIGIIDSIKYITFLLFLSCFILIGLISVEIPSFNVIIKRISVGKIEFEGINRVRYGLPLNKNYWIRQKKEAKQLEINQLEDEKENEKDSEKKKEIESKLEKKYDELLELNKELGTNIQKELKLKLEQSILGIKLLQRKRKKESDLNKKKDLDLELKQKKLDRDKYRINLSHEKKVALNIFNQKELKIELDRININLIQENQKTNPNKEDKEELELLKEHKEHKELELKLLKKNLELEKEKQKIDSQEKIQDLKLELNQITIDLVKKELELNQKRLEKVQKKLKKLEKELDLTKQKDAIEKLESEISKEIKEIEEIKEINLTNLKEIDKLDSEKLEKLKKLMLKLKKKKLKLVKIEFKEIELELESKEIELELELKKTVSDSENQKLKLEQKQKLKLELKQKALELVRIEIKFVQDKLDSEEYKVEVESKLINIKKSELYLELRQKKIKQELVEIKLELDQKKNSDSKEIDELKSESRHKKIELVKKEIEWTQKKLELVKKEIESLVKKKIESQLKLQLKIWYIRINYFLNSDPKYEDKELKDLKDLKKKEKDRKTLILELNSKTQELWYRRFKYHFIDCKIFLFNNLNVEKLYIYDNINDDDDDDDDESKN